MLNIEPLTLDKQEKNHKKNQQNTNLEEPDDELDEELQDILAEGVDDSEERDDDNETEPGVDSATLQRRREAEAIYGGDDDMNRPLDSDNGGWEEFFSEADSFTITRMTPGVKDPNRVNIFLDGHFAFSLDVSQVVDLNVKVKQKVDKERLKQLRDASEFGKLYQRTLEWVLTRPHSAREVQSYLHRRKYKRLQVNRQREKEEKKPLPELQEETIQLVLARLNEKGYLDDLKFAKFYVENRFARKGISKRRLQMELKKKGVSNDAIEIALETVERPEEEEILKVLKKKRAKYDDFKLISYLVRQGFDYQKVKEAVASNPPENQGCLFDDPI